MRRLRGPLPLGEHWALAQLRTEEYVCVDTRTLEALPYLLGVEHEADIIRILRTFLTPRSVVLDIGANFGLYTAITGRAVASHGRVYAFEGNPQAFDALRRTIVANELFDNPRVVAANRLVSDRAGRGTLYYLKDILVGGTMTDLPQPGSERCSVEVEMTTIDAFLPADLAVDLVKIDVEGHEPMVIRGMEQTIARSPTIRLIIEFVDAFLEPTMPAPQFVEYIRGLGFGICQCLPRARLRLVPQGEAITGFNYLLLTRTPEADIAAVERRRRHPPARLKHWLSRHLPDWGHFRRTWQRW